MDVLQQCGTSAKTSLHPSAPFSTMYPRLKKKKASKLHNLEIKHQACRFGPWKNRRVSPWWITNIFFHPAILVPSSLLIKFPKMLKKKTSVKSATFFHINQISPHLQKASSSAAHHLPSSRCHRWSCTKKGTISSGWRLWPSNATALLLNLMGNLHWLVGKKTNSKRLGWQQKRCDHWISIKVDWDYSWILYVGK